MRRLGRPAGSFGEVGLALVRAAEHGPGTARQLAERVCVGYTAARYTASRLVSAGVLARTDERPARLGLPGALPLLAQPKDAGTVGVLPRSFWDLSDLVDCDSA
jgi:hypothetical protein